MTNEERMLRQNIAIQAANLVRVGWCQEQSKETIDGEVCRCAARAIMDAGDGDYPIDPRVSAVIDSACSEVGGSLIQWNDEPCRTQAEVVALLERVASKYNPDGWQEIEV
jgi:hypothetical protein